MHSFAVAPVEPCRHFYRPYKPASKVLHAHHAAVVSMCNAAELVDPSVVTGGCIHPMLATVAHAYAYHFPLVLSPDDVWLCIVQGLAKRVNEHAEALRGRFVAHEGKKTVTLDESWLGEGTAEDWRRHLSAFADRVAEDIGKRRDLLVAAFSTTGPVERAAFEIGLLDTVQHYFDYRSDTICGIPFVTLLGTPEDWRSLRRRAEMLPEFGLSDWARVLLPVLDRFVAASVGDVDVDFWRSIYKMYDHCGDPLLTGWINVLLTTQWSPGFPIDALLKMDERKVVAAMRVESYPTGLSRAPFTRCFAGREQAMEFVGGFVGASQDPTTAALRPVIGWWVRHVEADMEQKLPQNASPIALPDHRRQQVFVQENLGEAVSETDAAIHFDLGLAYAEMGLRRDAISEFATATRSAAFTCRALMKKAQMHVDLGEHDEALSAFTHALQANPTPEEEHAIRKALAHASGEQFLTAKRSLQ